MERVKKKRKEKKIEHQNEFINFSNLLIKTVPQKKMSFLGGAIKSDVNLARSLKTLLNQI